MVNIVVANFLKYITARLSLAFFAFLLASYFSMYILFEQIGGERYDPILWLITAILSLLISSVFLSFLGQLRFDRFLNKTGEYDLSLNSRKAISRFERLLKFASSFYFFPTTTEKLLKKAYKEYSKLLLGLHARSGAAQEVYEETIKRHPEDGNLQNMLIDIYSEKENLSKREQETCFRIFKHSPGNRKVIETLSKYYIDNNIFDFDSQEIFTRVIKLNTASKQKAVDLLILKLIELQREDDFAAIVYLTAYSEYSNRSEPVIEPIIKLALDRKKRGRTDDLSQKIYRIYEEIPEKTRKPFEEHILKMQPREKGAFVSKDKLLKELISGLLIKIYDYIQVGKTSLRSSILKFQSFKIFNLNLKKTSLFIFFSSISLAVVLLVVIMALQRKKDVKPSINLLNINPQYTVYESKLLYSIQVAAFKTLEKAEQVMNKLSLRGEKSYYTKKAGKSDWYRIRLGEFNTKKEAKKYAEKLLKAKLIKGYFITNFEPGFIKIDER